MASINISIRKEAYEFLKELKVGEGSFSDVILSFKKNERDIMQFFGVLKNGDWKEKEENMKKFRTNFNKRLK